MRRFRLVAICEGISLIILLFIAMPLKYIGDMPAAVKYAGWIHGLLFVIYQVILVRVWVKYKWPFKKVIGAFIASFLPFGTFILDRRLQKEYTHNSKI
ncbi:MAG TPA: DUF3817 domain-containing protein [Ferruginibacter sp.]|nr:DUF3817 domain-containing protein [Ferruginibacter sp.]